MDFYRLVPARRSSLSNAGERRNKCKSPPGERKRYRRGRKRKTGRRGTGAALHYSNVSKQFASIGRFNTRDTILSYFASLGGIPPRERRYFSNGAVSLPPSPPPAPPLPFASRRCRYPGRARSPPRDREFSTIPLTRIEASSIIQLKTIARRQSRRLIRSIKLLRLANPRARAELASPTNPGPHRSAAAASRPSRRIAGAQFAELITAAFDPRHGIRNPAVAVAIGGIDERLLAASPT